MDEMPDPKVLKELGGTGHLDDADDILSAAKGLDGTGSVGTDTLIEGSKSVKGIENVRVTEDILSDIKSESVKLHELNSAEQMKIAQELKAGSPIPIPDDVVPIIKYNGYDQVTYKWNDGTYSYEVRWHTSTPNAPEGTPPNWRVDRKIPGTAGGKDPVTGNIVQGTAAIKEVLVAPPNQQAYYISRDIWNAATTAYSKGTATEAQKEILKWAHIITE